MRITHHAQRSLFDDNYADHALGQELATISELLDEHPEIYDYALSDLRRVDVNQTGRRGLTVEMVIRAAILKQSQQLSYDELTFYLEDSNSFHTFARLHGLKPKKSVLQKTISLISPATWERIHQTLLQSASWLGFESGEVIRIDATAIESNIHSPSDSSLLNDSIRVMNRLLKSAKELTVNPLKFSNRQRQAKGLVQRIIRSKRKKRQQYYRQLIKITEETLGYFDRCYLSLSEANDHAIKIVSWIASYEHYRPLMQAIVEQTKRRILHGEVVNAQEKVLSLFEPHSDIIAKSHRKIVFGHKINLVSGQSGMVLDVVVEQGNPADSERFLPMLDRQRALYDEYPNACSSDGCYASQDNLSKAKALGIQQVVFHKKRGLKIEEMAKSSWVYRKLKNFRAGIEANISCLKRAYGLRRCLWSGLDKFKSYVWSSVVSYNLFLMARLKLKSG